MPVMVVFNLTAGAQTSFPKAILETRIVESFLHINFQCHHTGLHLIKWPEFLFHAYICSQVACILSNHKTNKIRFSVAAVSESLMLWKFISRFHSTLQFRFTAVLGSN